MQDLSQRTLAQVMRVLDYLGPQDEVTKDEIHMFWERDLFAWDFPAWFIDYAVRKSLNWTEIIRALYDGKAFEVGASHFAPKAEQESLLKKLTTMAFMESEESVERENLRLSLEVDGFEISDGKLSSIQGPVSIAKERNRVLDSLRTSRFARKDLITKHLKDAEDHFSSNKMHSVLGESRSALQACIEDTVGLLEQKVGRRAGGGVKNQVEFLAKENFISPDEQQAFLAAWGFLSAGGHPGLPPDEIGRIGLIFGLEFIQVLLIKTTNL